MALTCATSEVVVKVLPRLHRERELMGGEAVALEHWSGTGAAVELLGTRDDGMTLLLRRLHPGTDLDDLPYDDQLVIAGRLVARMHAAGEPPASLPPQADYLAAYRDVTRVQDELAALLASADREVAVHADLHGGNVVRDGDRWVAIDPKGVRGDPHLDVWLLICPQAPALGDDPRGEAWRRIRIYSAAAQLDPERAAAWVRVIARAESELPGFEPFDEWLGQMRRLADALTV